MTIKPQQLLSGINSTWCPGCGDHFLLTALQLSLRQLDINHEDLLVVWGVGCAGNGADFMRVYGMHALHGRTLPVATGAKLANPKLKVIAIGGDGDGYGIGLSHFIHSARRNLDITYIVYNNQVYGLTTGQTSPTSEKGYCSKSTPSGVIEEPIKPLELALSSDATFVARAYYKNLKQVSQLFTDAILHKGFSLVDCLQICPSFKRNNTDNFYQEHVCPVPEEHDTSSKLKAFELAQDKTKLWHGLFYSEKKPTYCDELPQIAGKSPAQMYVDLNTPVGVQSVLKQYA